MAPRGGDGDRALVGRGREFAQLDAFVRAATGTGGVLLLTGEAGMGKSALLEAATGTARRNGARVLRASGVEFEADVAYAGLHQLLLPVAEELSMLGEVDIDPLRAALGLTSAQPPELLRLTTTTLGALRRLGDGRPLVLALDDLQWLDRATLHLLSFVSRRLDGSSVALLLAQRSGHETFFDRASIPTLELGPLDDDAAHALLRQHHPHLHPVVRQRIVADASGNPLALIELPRGLTAAQEAATEGFPPRCRSACDCDGCSHHACPRCPSRPGRSSSSPPCTAATERSSCGSSPGPRATSARPRQQAW